MTLQFLYCLYLLCSYKHIIQHYKVLYSILITFQTNYSTALDDLILIRPPTAYNYNMLVFLNINIVDSVFYIGHLNMKAVDSVSYILAQLWGRDETVFAPSPNTFHPSRSYTSLTCMNGVCECDQLILLRQLVDLRKYYCP